MRKDKQVQQNTAGVERRHIDADSTTPGAVEFIKKLGPALVLIVLCIVAGILSPVFFTSSNLLNIALQVSVIAIIAAGMTFVILTGGIDLSVGSILGFTGVLLAGIFKATGSIFLASISSIVVGGLLGLVNGVLVSYGNVPAFCATLGVMSMARGLAFVYTKGSPISSFPGSFRFFGAAYVGPIPVPVIEAVIIFVAAWYVLTKTPFGRSIYAIGSNEKASRLSGIKTNLHKMLAYVVNGVLTGFAALMFVGRINSAHPLAGQGYELDAIAAVVIGGTSLSGGQGSIVGTFLGALIMGVIRNALNLLNVDAYWQQVVIGAVIVIAVLMDRRSKKSRLA